MAVADLVRQGVVKRIPGRGTFFVKEPQLQIGVESIERMLHEWESLGFDPEAKVLSFCYLKADKDVPRKLKLTAGSKVLVVRRVRTTSGKPASIDVRYIAGWCAHVIRREDAPHLLLPVIERRLKIKAIASEQEIWAQGADQVMAEVLEVNVGAPILSREVTLIAEDERPISTGAAHHRADLVRFRVRAPGDVQNLELQTETTRLHAVSMQKA